MKTTYRKYTDEEVATALFKLNNDLEDAKDRRSEITKTINKIKKNIEFYENLDKRQIRIGWEL